MFKKFFSLKKFWIISFLFILFPYLISCKSQKKPEKTPNFHICTVASHKTRGLEQLLDSCKRFNVPIKILGLGLPFRGLSDKLLYVKKFLKDLPDDDVIMFVDAYDVLFMKTKEEILKQFLSMKVPFVIAVEAYCFPLKSRVNDFPPSPTPFFKFINSGTYIGYVKSLKEIFNEMKDIKPSDDDQARFMLHYFDNREKYTFDYYCKLFMPLPRVSIHHLEIDQKNFTVKCNLTNTFPCIIHGNGVGRPLYQYIYDYLFLHNPYFEKEEITLDRYLCQKGNWKIEGNCETDSTEQPKFLSELVKNPNIFTIGEIGFNAGHSSDLFLKNNEKAKIYSFDIMEHPYTIYGKKYIDLKYPKRHQLIEGNSLDSVPRFDKNIKFDLIFIDGGHTFTVALCDIINMRFHAKKDTILVIDDANFRSVKQAWQYCVDHEIITPGKYFSSGCKGWQQCKYIFE
jgi:predicted O-methyltransferase YrrM